MERDALPDALSETLSVFETSGEPRTTPEVAERLDLGRRSTYDRLQRLVERESLRTKKVGANARVWWRPAEKAVDRDRSAAGTEFATDSRELHSLIDAVEEYAIFTLDPDGYVRTWNAGAREIKGYEADEIVGEHISSFYTERDRTAQRPERNLSEAARNGSIQDEGWRVRADGSQFWANVTITAIEADDGSLQGYVKVTRDMTERRQRERSLRRERDLTEQLLETAPIGLVVFRPDGSIERINSRTRDRLGIDASTVDSFDFDAFDVYDSDGDPIPLREHPVTRAIEGDEPVSDELIAHEGPNGTRRWLSLTAEPVYHDGELERIVVAARDVTDLKRSEREFERQRDELADELEEVFDRISDGFYALDDELRFRYLNEKAASVLGVAESDIDREFHDIVTTTDAFDRAIDEARDTRRPVTFEDYYDPANRWFYNAIYPSETGLSVYFREITERKAQERKLARFERAVEAAGHSIYMTDPDGTITYVNPAFEALTGYSRDEAVGQRPSLFDAAVSGTDGAERFDSLEPGDQHSDEVLIRDASGDRYTVHQVVTPVTDDDGEVVQFVTVQTDVTERKERERELEQYERIVETVEDGIYVLDENRRFTMVNDGFEAMTGYDRDELLGREGTLVFGDEFVEIADRFQRELESGERDIAVLEEDISRADGTTSVVESRFDQIDLGGDRTGRVGVVRDVGERVERERELERQRERLTALNNLNQVVRDVTEHVIEGSTREQIEQTVCDALAASEAYEFAWVAEVDSVTTTFEPRAAAGTGGYANEITISMDPDDPRSSGPGATAIREQETQVVRDVYDDPRFEPWREAAAEYGFRSVASIPIVHDGTTYGVLGVYADRSNAFDAVERRIVSQLGEVVGHAIAAIERKRALMSDELVELEFHVRDVFAAFDASATMEGTVTLEHSVPVAENELLVYGTASPDARESLDELVEHLPHWQSITVRSDGDPIEFELRMREPPVRSVVSSIGGYVDSAVLENGEYRLRIRLAPNVDVHQVIEVVDATYPGAEMYRRKQVARRRDDSQIRRQPMASLTDRQRAALDAAYFAGFFEWPRETSGEAVANSLDIAAPTFHQHLRKAERKVLESVYESYVPESAEMRGD
ncbi:PAS domain S-box protein [Halovivax gelatinilyticus]|uniref:PAS domain S-box protein n=1 Tax=Halovivax gelatinilyticus TaxID=2961597 RepID=UPI0020CA2C00|nr:PAS domain S-box protein [Halovivax gelatinilyticus]